MQTAQNRIDGQAKHAAVVIIEPDLQPFESFIPLASHCVNLGDLIGIAVPSRSDELGQSCIRCGVIAADMMSERQFEETKSVVGLELRFSQSCVAVAALNGDEYLPAVTGRGGRLQFRLFT